ncbi:MAG: MotA/TolQ/ExbB proton channel family protein [Pseudomonadales bacterium]|jgi:biopolymer transport protein ExbB|nr:MotA/TolQ/ExbB proton channel family protein [Pseudomonadales bacterium]
MFNDAYLAIITFMEMGGDVLWYIAAITFLMWTLIFERIWFFRTEHKDLVLEGTTIWETRSERNSWSAHQVREGIVSNAASRIMGSLPVIETCVALCPLFGLLGTVTGMIAVFDAMATQGGNARSMAAGVSMATIPTMSGMIASLSGLIGTTYLKRKVEYETQMFEDTLTLDH